MFQSRALQRSAGIDPLPQDARTTDKRRAGDKKRKQYWKQWEEKAARCIGKLVDRHTWHAHAEKSPAVRCAMCDARCAMCKA
mmetsp:Transcript_13079/g.19629  ORF Transcript_13079/g.19629 Transcript_13079/m.19629 type:complete len:82 (-) Transcript_13079:66-311(-)